MTPTAIDNLFTAVDVSGVSTNVSTLLIAFIGINLIQSAFTGRTDARAEADNREYRFTCGQALPLPQQPCIELRSAGSNAAA